MSDENKLICRRLLEEAWSKGAYESVDETVAPECRFHDPAFPSLEPGAKNYKKHIHMCREAFPDLTCTVDDIVAERNEVVIHWTVRGTHRGRFLGLDATNRPVTVSGTSIHRLAEGRIVEIWSDWNSQSLRDQLGLKVGAEVEINKALARRYVEEVWNQKNPDRIPFFVSRDFVRFSPNGALHGAHGLRQDYDLYMNAFPDTHLRIDDMICEGQQVAIRFSATGTHAGKLGQVAPSGRSVSLTGASILRMANGKITEEHVVWDNLSLMQQVGALPESARVSRGGA